MIINCRVRHILNVTREIDNFFPGMFDYCNVRVYDDEKTDLLKHWDNTFKYISRAKMEGSKVLVHCKMGISRSASVVIAYAMKAYNWDFCQAIKHVKEKRNCIKPNNSFVSQLETYQGILDAMKNKEKLQRSKSETNLKSENSKDGKMLPGSEPTPLIQALQHSKNSTYPSSKKEASYLKRISQRPSSSPDISKSTSEAISLAKPISLSLETLVTVDATTENQTSVSETTNLRWPCNYNGNYGHYSISQNQIIYLENESANDPSSVPLVRSIVKSNDTSTKASTLKLQQRRQQFKKPGAVTTDCLPEKKKRDNQQAIGKVKNLKMNFEAKANTNLNATIGGNNKNCHSLPSSPIANLSPIHIDVTLESSESFPSGNSEDIKTLIDRYDGAAKMRNILLPNTRQRPRSLFETKYNMKTFQPALITHQTIFQKSEEFKRPPIPSQQPTVKNALMASNQNVNVKNAGNCRKTQHGKTHPLSKLGINKQRLNTSPAAAYNTM